MGQPKARRWCANGRTGRCSVYYRGERMALYRVAGINAERIDSQFRQPHGSWWRKKAKKAKKDHPWRRGYQNMQALDSQPGDRRAANWNAHLRFALNRRASLQCAFQPQHQPQKGDISNKLKMGTFLISLDTKSISALTFPGHKGKLPHSLQLPFPAMAKHPPAGTRGSEDSGSTKLYPKSLP